MGGTIHFKVEDKVPCPSSRQGIEAARKLSMAIRFPGLAMAQQKKKAMAAMAERREIIVPSRFLGFNVKFRGFRCYCCMYTHMSHIIYTYIYVCINYHLTGAKMRTRMLLIRRAMIHSTSVFGASALSHQ